VVSLVVLVQNLQTTRGRYIQKIPAAANDRKPAAARILTLWRSHRVRCFSQSMNLALSRISPRAIPVPCRGHLDAGLTPVCGFDNLMQVLCTYKLAYPWMHRVSQSCRVEVGHHLHTRRRSQRARPENGRTRRPDLIRRMRTRRRACFRAGLAMTITAVTGGVLLPISRYDSTKRSVL
jgi:hypothetical protein